ncbi:hypothetical protein [Paenibacillus dakarensis]|uniref:hypothetical protein n=1 Tax=Paenibacillus dakarensis TaxID=1527293 RepID=UPI000A67B46A|nr:hypothetical protein [Paenibacillus dakarensis]
MEYAELVQRVGWGEEFQFYYKNEQYWISTNEEGYYLTRGKDSYTLRGYLMKVELMGRLS